MMIRKPWWQVYMNEATDGTEGGASGGAAEGDADAEGGDASGEPAGEPKDMLEAINRGLDGKTETASTLSAEEQAAADAKAAEEKAEKELAEKVAAGDPAAIAAKAEADAKKAAEAAKPKDLKTLELTDADKKMMKAATATRYNEVLTIAKTERARADAAEARASTLAESRDAILGVLEQTQTSDEDLVQLLEFNRLTKTGKPEDLKAALGVVNAQRAHLMKALGVAGDGYDPLQEHPDLLKDVEDQKITQERALELVANRRAEALRRAGETKAKTAEDKAAQQAEQQSNAIASIEKWGLDKARTDIDYKAKEPTITARIEQIVRDYPPHLWLKTIENVYAAIVVSKPAAAANVGGGKPLRPSGAKPGGAAPSSMSEAIDQALGYAKT